jgi:UDP-2-acetamido-2,6-beta-L-arabino-hexul-4-ose reductase
MTVALAKIIGTGTIAEAFQESKLGGKFVILASGVSDSSCEDANAFSREFATISKVLLENKGSTFIYFSSLRARDINAYYRHKSSVENMLFNSQEFVHIYRVPQVISMTNKRTLVGFLFDRVINTKKFSLRVNAERYLLAPSDLVRLVGLLSNSYIRKSCLLNLKPMLSISVMGIVQLIEDISGRKAIFEKDFLNEDHLSELLLSTDIPVSDVVHKKRYYENALRESYTDMGSQSC